MFYSHRNYEMQKNTGNMSIEPMASLKKETPEGGSLYLAFSEPGAALL